MIDITSSKSFESVQYWIEQITKVRSSPYPFMLVGSHSKFLFVRSRYFSSNAYAVDDELNRICQRDTVEIFLKNFEAKYVEYSASHPAPNIHRILTHMIGEIQTSRKQLLVSVSSKAMNIVLNLSSIRN